MVGKELEVTGVLVSLDMEGEIEQPLATTISALLCILPNVGIVKYSNSVLEALKITPGTFVTFTPASEFEFVIDNERLYCMKSNDIALINEYEGNEKEYNPSWA